MAEDTLVLSNLLCFLSSKYGKCTVKVLKSALIDFYDDTAIIAAKTRLLNDLRSMNLTEKTPHLPTRREGENRLIREVDDIFTVFVFLDERKLLNKLPKYVADGPDSMPSTRLYAGDLKVFMDQLMKMDTRMAALSSSLDTVVHDVRALQTKSMSTRSSFSSAVSQSTPVRRANNNNNNTTGIQRVAGLTTAEFTGGITGGIPRFGQVIRPSQVAGDDDNVNNGNTHQQFATGTDWASASEFIPALSTNNPYGALVNTEALQTDDATDAEEQPFTLYESRDARRKRLRQHSRQQQQQAAAAGQQTPAIKGDTRPRRGPLMIGKSVSPTSSSSITAANCWYRKAVFYVDNVEDSVTVSDLEKFVLSLSVRLVSCHEVKPRRRRNETDMSSSKAFRLCINRDDRDRLLDANKWPAYVGISDWIFKSSNVGGQGNKRQKTDNHLTEKVAVAAGRQLLTDISSDSAPTDAIAMDTTILAGTAEYNAPECSISK
jgi:hypothetical protein